MNAERAPAPSSEPELAAGRFDEACEAYLERRLPAPATRAFERALLEPALAQRFREALLVRELLGSVGPDAPAGLADRLESLVCDELAREGRGAGASGRGSLLGGWRAALGGLSWTLRGPSLAFTSQPAAPSGAGPFLQGLGTMRYAVPALAEGRAAREPARRAPLWWRLLRGRRT
ncbi:MAG: hypothetical protein HY908_08945 [Myxococcales bacterium]|nr:hypothetical protein [Myxococcales bacterium]